MKINSEMKMPLIILSICVILTIIDSFIKGNHAEVFFIIETILLVPLFWLNYLYNRYDNKKNT